MGKRVKKIAALVLCLTVLSGCRASLLDPENAIRAPHTSGRFAGLQKAVEQQAGEPVILKYPLVQGKRSAFFAADLDGNGSEEYMVFYQPASNAAVTRVDLFSGGEGEFTWLQTLEPAGSDILEADCGDLDGDGNPEVCIGWNLTTIHSNWMCVYQYQNDSLIQRAAEPYTKYALCDMNNDGATEICLATLDTENKTSSVSFFRLKQERFYAIGSLLLDGSVISYGKMTAANVASKTVGVYLDAYKGTDAMITELVYLKGGQPYNPFLSNADGTNTVTLRRCSLAAADINEDGVMDIPFMENMPGYRTEEEDPVHHLICWRYFDGSMSDPTAVWWYQESAGFYLELPRVHWGDVTVTYNSEERSYAFYQWNGKKIGERLFTLRGVSQKEWDANPLAGYQKLDTVDTTVWTVETVADNAWGWTAEKLISAFHPIMK